MRRAFKNNSGFFTFHFILFVSLISVLLISYGFIFYAQKQKDLFRKTCYYDLPRIQKQIVQFEKGLFRLNPLSTALRRQLQFLKIQLAAALATQNGPLIAQITLNIKQVEQAQMRLDQTQKIIINAAENSLKSELLTLYQNTVRKSLIEKELWKVLLFSNQEYDLKLSTEVAVRPDLVGEVAPNYELKTHYEKLQMLNLTLHHHFNNNKQFQTRMNTQQSYRLLCQVSINKKDHEWHLIINQDKSL